MVFSELSCDMYEGYSKKYIDFMCVRFKFFLSKSNILCINENLCPFVTRTESATACVPISSKKKTFKLP